MAERSDWHYYGQLFPHAVRIKLVVALAGSVVASLLETVAILLLVPLLSILNGNPIETGVIGSVWRALGEPSRDQFLVYIVLASLLGFIAKDIAVLAFRWWLVGFNATENVRVSAQMLLYFLHAPYEEFRRRGVPDILRVVGEVVGSFYGKTVGGIVAVITEGISIASVLVALLVVMPWHTLAITAYFGLVSFLYLRWMKPRLEKAAVRQLEANVVATGAMLQSLGGIEEIKIRHAQAHFVARVRLHQTDAARASRVAGFLMEMPKYILEVTFIVGLGVLIVLSLGQGLLETIALLAAAAFRLLPSVTRLVASLGIVRSGEPARLMLLEELRNEDSQGRPADDAIATHRLALTDALIVDHVSFTYSDSRAPVLRDVTFRVPAGSSVALVGGSGAGKTTLGNLLLGLLAPTSGRILVDGVDIAGDMSAWQNCIGFVPQDVFHLDMPFDVNIAFDRRPEDIDEERLWAAIDRAQLRGVLQGLPEGVKTRVGDRAARLSGGQRQRVGIARALYREPDFLLLDEATSALDNETERQVTDTLASLHGKLTTVVIAHRLSTVRHVDRIIFLKDGTVTGSGTFDELAQTSAEFARMVELGRLD